MRTRPLSLLALLVLFACKRVPPESSPEETHGCITLMKGEVTACTEVDVAATESERALFASACVSSKLLEGRRVAHCDDEEIAAECAMPAEKMTMRYYRKSWNSETERGATMGCKIRAGTFRTR